MLSRTGKAAGFVPDIPSLSGDSPIERFAGFASEIVTGLRFHAGTFAGEHKARISEYASELAEKSGEMTEAFRQFADEYDAAVSELSKNNAGCWDTSPSS